MAEGKGYPPPYPDSVPVVTVGVGNDQLATCRIEVEIVKELKLKIHIQNREIVSIEEV